jgi:hypothetical protein
MFQRLTAFVLMLLLMPSSFAFSESEHRQNETFPVKLFTQASKDWKLEDALLSFEKEHIVLRMPKNESQTLLIAYSEIKSVEYSHSKTRRSLSVPMALAANVFALPLLLNGVENHWLTLRSETNPTFLSLDKSNYQTVLAAFEANAGRKVAGWNIASAAVVR